MPTYLLSNKQRKELMVRGRRLDLALPLPQHPVADLVEWAQSVLPQDLRQYVRSARRATVMAAPKIGASQDTLTDVLGTIVHEKPPAWWWVTQILAVVVELAPEHTRHTAIDLQWPLDVVIDDRRLLGDR